MDEVKKIKKHYVQRLQQNPEGKSSNELICKNCIKVSQKIPFSDIGFVEHDPRALGFRFLDLTVYCYKQEFSKRIDATKKYSPWIYYGERITSDVLLNTFSNQLTPKSLKILERNQDKDFCFTQTGVFILMNDNDMTFAEYLTSLNERKKENHVRQLKK